MAHATKPHSPHPVILSEVEGRHHRITPATAKPNNPKFNNPYPHANNAARGRTLTSHQSKGICRPINSVRGRSHISPNRANGSPT